MISIFGDLGKNEFNHNRLICARSSTPDVYLSIPKLTAKKWHLDGWQAHPAYRRKCLLQFSKRLSYGDPAQPGVTKQKAG